MDLYSIRNDLAMGKSIFDIPMRVTYYARVSTDKDEQLHSLSAQVQYYSDFIKANPSWSFVEGYVDEGLSGTSVKKRDSFLQMLEDAHLDKFDFIVTKEISRFSRNTLDSIQYTQQLLKYGVGVLFQSDNINTLLPDSELRLTIMASIAQDEVRKISERVKFGFKRAIDSGVVLGNNRIWGYQKNGGKLVIDEKEAEIVRIIFDLYANRRMGMRSICNYLSEHGYKNSKGNAFSFSTIKGILSNPKYKGYYCGGKSHKYDYKLSNRKKLSPEEWIMYRDEEVVPPIVSEELWEKANNILAVRSKSQTSGGYHNKYKYSGKIFCSVHETAYHRGVYKYKSGNREVWRCKQYVEKGKNGCKLPIVYTSELDEIVKKTLEKISIHKTSLVHELTKIYTDILATSSPQSDIAKLKNESERLLQMKDKLLDLSLKGRLSDEEFELRNKKFNQEIAKLEAQMVRLDEEEEKNREIALSLSALQHFILNELDFSAGADAGVTDALIDKIEVYPTEHPMIIRLEIQVKLLSQTQTFYIDRRKKPSAVLQSYPNTPTISKQKSLSES
jgi:site-specific DNA recombinase